MSQPRRRRRSYSPDEKAAILRRHLAEKVPISALAEEYGIQPSVAYQWQRQLLDHAAAALRPQNGKPDRHERKLVKRIEALEARLVSRTRSSPVLAPDGTWIASFVSTWKRTAGGWRVVLDVGPRCPPPASAPEE